MDLEPLLAFFLAPLGTYFHRFSASSDAGHCESCGLGLVCLGGREGSSTNSSAPHQAGERQHSMADLG